MWGHQKLFSDCFPWEQDSCDSKKVMGLCFSEERGRESLLWRSQVLRANSTVQFPPLAYYHPMLVNKLGFNRIGGKPSFPEDLHYFLSGSASQLAGRVCYTLRSALERCPQGLGACRLPTGQGLLFSLLLQKQKKMRGVVAALDTSQMCCGTSRPRGEKKKISNFE